ncbi:MAG: DUF1553 domain-containing protein, partial [Planctomycetaceae bacterium]|nr:DUF1553 domain-containing protein [Planctomycetaceae bacterium]
ADKIHDQAIRIRGVRTQKGEVVPRNVPQLFSGSSTGGAEPGAIPAEVSGRRELAEWLAGPAAPLVARVTVNRVWQHLFGEGLVRTVDNFGRMGEAPSHPELLDWLAGEFIQRDWSLKWLVREIVLSRSWQASSRFDSAAFDIDPENRLLWRMPVRRLDAEPLRDAMLAIAGQLTVERSRASVVGELDGNELNDRIRLTPAQLNQTVRSLYLPLARMSLPEQLELFDFADPSLSIGQRGERILPAQRLFLFNSELMHGLATAAAQRLMNDAPDSPTRRVELAWLRFFGRRPDSAEREIALEAVEQAMAGPSRSAAATAAAAPAEAAAETERELRAWALLCQALFAAGEFQSLE